MKFTPSRILTATLTAATLLAVTAGAARAQGVVNREYQIKAGYLWFFGHYVQWPEAAFANSGDKFVIGILGRDPFGQRLASVIRKPIRDRPIVLRRFASLRDLTACHILFVSDEGGAAASVERLRAVGAATRDQPVLIVSETRGGARQGAVINFAVDRGANRVVLEINLAAARARGLTVSARLLALQNSGVVRIVRGDGPAGDGQRR